MIASSRTSSAILAAAVLISAFVGYRRDGALDAILWGLAGVGGVSVVRSLLAAYRKRAKNDVTVAGSTADDAIGVGGEPVELGIPPDLDAELRSLAHDLHSPIAVAAAAFAAFDERVGEMAADEDTTYFRATVRRSLAQATERVRGLERSRKGWLGHKAAETGERVGPATPRKPGARS